MRLAITILLVLCTLSVNMRRIETESDEFSEQHLYSYILKLGVKYPDIVMAQAKIESGHFTSNIFKENNNLFGMRFPRQRKTTAIGVNRGHSVYTSWKTCVMDYKLWQERMLHKIDNEKDYLAFLERNYAQDGKYVHKLNQIKNNGSN